MKKKLFLTGANGFLGKNILETPYFQNTFQIISLIKNKKNLSYPTHTPMIENFYIGETEWIKDIPAHPGDVFLHTAWEMHPKHSEKNLKTIQDIKILCAQNSMKCIFISSMAATGKNTGQYGKTKYLAENLLADLPHKLIVKPGTITGNGGLYLKMKKLVQKFPIIPVFFGGHQKIHLISIQNCLLGLENAIQKNQCGKIILADAKPCTIRELYLKIAQELRVKRLLIPMPGTLSLWGLIFLEYLGLELPITSDQLKSLKSLS